MVRYIIFLLLLISITHPAFSQEKDSPVIDGAACQCSVSRAYRDQRMLRLSFAITNMTEFKKVDLPSDMRIFVSDGYNNTYTRMSDESQAAGSHFSIYPEQSYAMSYAFELPVEGVSDLMLHVVSNDQEICQAPFRFEDPGHVAIPEPDDIVVIYPKSIKRYHPGETVFIKLDFSERAGRPQRLHILLAGKVYTDTQSRGRYEVKVPEENIEDGLEIIVIGEWPGVADIPVTVSKTIHIDVADNGVS